MSEPNPLTLTAEIVACFVEKNRIAVTELPDMIRSVHRTLASLGQPEPSDVLETKKLTAAQIRKSITPDALISFEDGRPYKMLKRHLTSVGLTPADYRAKWGLPKDYPMTAATYAASRSALAKSIGLGQGGRQAPKAAVATKAPPVRKPRTKQPRA
jgi:predicted transcriptional regulator